MDFDEPGGGFASMRSLGECALSVRLEGRNRTEFRVGRVVARLSGMQRLVGSTIGVGKNRPWKIELILVVLARAHSVCGELRR